jgi:hypothetical protein
VRRCHIVARNNISICRDSESALTAIGVEVPDAPEGKKELYSEVAEYFGGNSLLPGSDPGMFRYPTLPLLLRAIRSPQPDTNRGGHQFIQHRFSLFTNAGGFAQRRTVMPATSLAAFRGSWETAAR